MSLTCRRFIGPEIAEVLDPFARLRIDVFRDWPYLYQGDLDYERAYLARYAQGDTILVAAFDGDRMVGASTGMPLSAHADDLAQPFRTFTHHINKIFYCAETVVYSDFRGRGLYRHFFTQREAHARHLDCTFAAFCAVQRPAGHPLRPDGHRALDAVWRRFGYAPLPGIVARFRWRDIGATQETDKPMQFWGKPV